jgi:hypothetical protein
MQATYDFPDDMDFADDAIMRRMRREQRREQQRLATLRSRGPGRRRGNSDYGEDYDDYGDDDDDGYEDYEDYDDDEFDEYSRIYRD